MNAKVVFESTMIDEDRWRDGRREQRGKCHSYKCQCGIRLI